MMRSTKLILLLFLILTPIFCTNYRISETLNDNSSEKEDASTDQRIQIQNKGVIFEENFGDQQDFWIPISDYVLMRATLLSVGTSCYIYMANETINLMGEANAISKCDSLRDEFDAVIYPKAIEIAGHPDGRFGDVDGDPKVTIFLAPLVRHMGQAYLGFYLAKDDDSSHPYSNRREMVYVDSEMSEHETVCITIHEFNHLIWMNNELDESELLMEGAANYAIDYSGYDSWVTDVLVNSYLSHPEISLLYFNRVYGNLWDASYGQSYLFVLYLAERYGNGVIRNLVEIQLDGANAVDRALADAGYDVTFNDVYLDWITACVIDEVYDYDGLYGFESVDYQISNVRCFLGDFLPVEEKDVEHFYYGFNVKQIILPKDYFTFEIESPPQYALGISIAIKDKNGWNVTQKLYTDESMTIVEYISGDEIDEVYIITSLMNNNTPSEYGIITLYDNPPPSLKLDYSFTEWHYGPNLITESIWILVLGIIVITIIGIVIIFFIRKKKESFVTKDP